ncbi:LOW QUALITY PROTEIN: predicted protein, partial [Brucella sp. F5/99]
MHNSLILLANSNQILDFVHLNVHLERVWSESCISGKKQTATSFKCALRHIGAILGGGYFRIWLGQLSKKEAKRRAI